MKKNERLERLAAEFRSHPEFFLSSIENINQEGDLTEDAIIHIATRSHDINIIIEAIALGADVNLPGDYGFTPLHYAARRQDVGIIKLLLKHGARTTTLNEWGQTALDEFELGKPQSNTQTAIIRKLLSK